MWFLSGSRYSQDFFGNIYSVDKKTLDKKAPISETIKNKKHNSGWL